jgi:hypothetical protein
MNATKRAVQRRVLRDTRFLRCPRLRSHIVAGGGVVELQLGNVGREGDLERYLVEHPDPIDW